jgi:hypothetical protein
MNVRWMTLSLSKSKQNRDFNRALNVSHEYRFNLGAFLDSLSLFVTLLKNGTHWGRSILVGASTRAKGSTHPSVPGSGGPTSSAQAWDRGEQSRSDC